MRSIQKSTQIRFLRPKEEIIRKIKGIGEKFTDFNQNGIWDRGEKFEDTIENDNWDSFVENIKDKDTVTWKGHGCYADNAMVATALFSKGS